jgi:hypothetical protein
VCGGAGAGRRSARAERRRLHRIGGQEGGSVRGEKREREGIAGQDGVLTRARPGLLGQLDPVGSSGLSPTRFFDLFLYFRFKENYLKVRIAIKYF